MVQALREIIELNDYDEASLKEALSSFKCYKENEESTKDVVSFLKNDAINNEKSGISRTYLHLNDEAWAKGKIVIEGYFSIAIKNLYFNEDVSSIEKLYGEIPKSIPAYLIGQLARAECTVSGFGKMMLNEALEYICSASNLAGGRVVYLDCLLERKTYYESNGYEFLQDKRNDDKLIQMYRII